MPKAKNQQQTPLPRPALSTLRPRRNDPDREKTLDVSGKPKPRIRRSRGIKIPNSSSHAPPGTSLTPHNPSESLRHRETDENGDTLRDAARYYARMNVRLVLVTALVGFPLSALAAVPEPAKPVEVTAGIYLNQVRELSLRDNQFVADFWIWFRWKKGAVVDPLATFEIVGGDIASRTNETREDLTGGEWSYATARIVARVVQVLDISEFPQDRHRLVIAIEDGEHEAHEVTFAADSANSRLDPKVHVPGFQVANFETVIVQHAYKTNYGDVTLPSDSESTFSRFEFALNVERPGFGYTLKLVWGMWLSALVALLALFIKPVNVDPRFGLGVGAIFAAMANQYIVSSALPDSATVTSADIVGMATIVVILVGVAESVGSLWLFENERVAHSKRLDRYTIISVLCMYAAVNVYAFAFR